MGVNPGLRSELEAVGHAREAGRLVGLEHVAVEPSLQERVVDPEEHVSEWLADGKAGLGHERPGVARGELLDFYAGGLRERFEGLRRQPERVVGEQGHGRAFETALIGGSVPAAGGRKQGED